MRIQGNARGCLIYEPLFILPFSMYMTYATVYMFKLGLSEWEIGFITSIGLVLQIFISFISGHLTDKMGRRRALLYYDLLSWSLVALVWAISMNFWYFLIAVILNSFMRVPNTAWYCLLVEDTDPNDRSLVFRILQIIGVVGGLIAPLGGLMVNHFTLVPAMRMMYILFGVCVTIMMFVRHFATHETEIGIKKRAQNTQFQLRDALQEYIDTIKMVLSNRPLMLVFGVYILFNFQMTLQNTYQSLFLVEALQISDSLIAIFPAVSSVAMLALIFLVIPKFKEEKASKYMIWGFMLAIASKFLLILTGEGQIAPVIVSTILGAAGSIIAIPYLEAAVANAIDDDKRAKMFSILQVLVLVFIFPAGIIGGWTYMIDPRLPFILIMVAFALSIMLLALLVRKQALQKKLA